MRGAPAVGALLVLVIAALAAALAGAPPSPAFPDYVHGGISPVACEVCHTDDHTNWPVASEKCLTCHTGYDAPDLPVTCWTCHTPGQDMAAARTDAACTATCHLPGGSTSLHSAHDSGGLCTSCHPVSPSSSDAGGDPHHVLAVPAAPAVTGFTPAGGAPGTLVTVTGTGIVKVTGVAFGGVPATTFRALSTTTLTAVVPQGAMTGPVALTNAGGAGASSASFVVPGRVTASVTIAAAPAALPRGARILVTGSVGPASLGGARVGVTVQYKRGSRWLKANALTVRSGADGGFSWTWLPPKKALYRVRATLTATALHTAAHSAWAAFRAR